MIEQKLLEYFLNATVFIAVLSVLIIVHEFGHFIAAKKLGVKVQVFSLGFGRRLFTKKRKETEYTVSAILLGGYVKLAGDNLDEYKGNPDEYLYQPVYKRFNIIFFGPLMNYIFSFLIFWFVFYTGYPVLTTKVGAVVDGLGAKEAGIQAGDRIVLVENQKVEYWEDLTRLIQSQKTKEKVKISLSRNNQQLNIDVLLKQNVVTDIFGRKFTVAQIGVRASDETTKIRSGIIKSLFLGINRTYELTAMTYKALYSIIIRRLPAREAVAGPVAIFDIVTKVAREGITALLLLMAILSTSLAIFNLLPLPALDGGNIFLLGVEKIRGKNLSKKTESILSQIGIGFIIILAVLVTFNDLERKSVFDKIGNFFKKTTQNSEKIQINGTASKTQN